MTDRDTVADLVARDAARAVDQAQAISLKQVQLARAVEYVRRVLALTKGDDPGGWWFRRWAEDEFLNEHAQDDPQQLHGDASRQKAFAHGVLSGVEWSRPSAGRRYLDGFMRALGGTRAREAVSELAWLATSGCLFASEFEACAQRLDQLLLELEPNGEAPR